LIPLVFVVIGFGGIIGTIKKALRGDARGLPDWMPESASEKESKPGYSASNSGAGGKPAILEPKHSAMSKLIGMLIFALIWNGVVFFIIRSLVNSFKRGSTDIGLMIFALIFGAIGLALIGGVFYFVLALFNPRPRIFINKDKLTLGDRLDLKWQITGNTSKISTLTLSFEGREEATYRRGTNTYTDKNVFRTEKIVETHSQAEMQTGTAFLDMPVDTMHSFAAENNKIIWSLIIHGDIKNWPDVKEEFEIVVLPKIAG
jgi:hypothetical protein